MTIHDPKQSRRDFLRAMSAAAVTTLGMGEPRLKADDAVAQVVLDEIRRRGADV